MVSEVARSSDRRQLGSETQQIDPEAHEAYLRGRYFWNKRTAEDLNTGEWGWQDNPDTARGEG